MTPRSNVLVLSLLAACSRASEPVRSATFAEDKAVKIAELTAEELVKLNRRRIEHSELSEADRAVLAEYDSLLERVMRNAEATWPEPDATKPCIVTRDFELWVLPDSGKNCYTVKGRDGTVLAERVDEGFLRFEFSYLHNLLHPEYLQFYDGVDY